MAEDQHEHWWQRYRGVLVLVLIGYAVALGVLWALGGMGQFADLTTAYFVIANLAVLWWYADLTRWIATTGERQFRFAYTEYRIGQKPVVFLDAVKRTDDRGLLNVHYAVSNVGPGLAVNVYLARETADGQWDTVAMGAVEPHGTRLVLGSAGEPLENHRGAMPAYIVVAEGMKSRTQRWIVTLNVLDGQGDVWHRFPDFDAGQELLYKELLKQYGSMLSQELHTFRTDVAVREAVARG